MLRFKTVKKKKKGKKAAVRRDAVYVFTLNGALVLCCHRSLIQCVIANGLIIEGERGERRKRTAFQINCVIDVFGCSLMYFVHQRCLWLNQMKQNFSW